MSEGGTREIIIQTGDGTFHRLTEEVLGTTKMSDEEIDLFLRSEPLAQPQHVPMHTQVTPTGFARVSPTFFARVAPSGFVRMTPTGFARIAPSAMVRAAPSAMVRAAPSGFVRAVPSGFVRAAPSAFVRAAAPASGTVRGWTRRS